jgi:P4 family phage/plasmid primase-like protien
MRPTTVISSEATEFDTIEYCKSANIPSFSIGIGWDREKGKKVVYFPDQWQTVEEPLIKPGVNGFAIVTGHTYWGLDFDNCFEELPEAHQELLRASCNSIVKTPRGYHFYFLTTATTRNYTSRTNIMFNGKKYNGIDIRARGGCLIAPPSMYKAEEKEMKYTWLKGNLSSCKEAPREVLELLEPNDMSSVITTDPNSEEIQEPPLLSKEAWEEVVKLVEMLSTERATNYGTWRDVIFCLKNIEFSERMLELCHDFSMRCYKKYDAKSVEKKFYSRTTKEKKFTINSLYYWAKLDSPDEYQNLLILRNYNTEDRDNWLYNELIDGQVSLANIYYKLYGQDLLLVYEKDRNVRKTFYMFNYETRLWDPTSKEILSSDISTKLSLITKDLLKRFIDKSCNLDKLSNDEQIKRQRTELEQKIKELRKLHLAIQDIKKGFSIACHVINCKQKSQYGNVNMNKNPKYLSVLNGMVNLETGELIERTHEHYQTFHIPVNYDEDADTRLMEKFMDNMFKPSEKDVQDLLCNVIGYAISGVADQKCMPIIIGDGDNGKSLLINILEELLGGYFGKVEYEELSASNTNVNNDTLYNARFARIIIIIETAKNAKLNERRLKNISGTDRASVSGKFKAAEQMTDECVPFIVSNFKPEFTGDKTVWNRILMIPLNMQFLDRENQNWDEEAFKAGEIKEKDPEFIKDLYGNMEGILKWVVMQSEAYFKDGFKIPETVKEAKERYRKTCMKKENTEIGNYIKNTWVKDDNAETELKTIIEQYREDYPEDSLLSDGQIKNIILDSIKGLGVKSKRKDIIVGGERITKTIWTIKKQGN